MYSNTSDGVNGDYHNEMFWTGDSFRWSDVGTGGPPFENFIADNGSWRLVEPIMPPLEDFEKIELQSLLSELSKLPPIKIPFWFEQNKEKLKRLGVIIEKKEDTNC